MNENNKKHKDVKFHKVKTQCFNNAKKYKLYKSTNQIPCLKTSKSPPNKRSRRKSIRSLALNEILKKVGEQYLLPDKNNKLIIPKKNQSSSKINMVKLNNLFPKKVINKKDQTNIKANKNHINPNKSNVMKSFKNCCSSNQIKHLKTFWDKKINLNKNKNEVEINLNEKETLNNYFNDNDIDNNNNINKYKIKLNCKKNEEEKKNSDDTKDKVKNVVKTIKRKFLCCL